MIIDFHTHAFPDRIAKRAMASLQAGAGDFPVFHDGTVGGLLNAMDRAGVTSAVVASIATKPAQFESILEWSVAVAGERIIPLASIHPRSADFAGEAEKVAAASLAGIKLHPMYQEFDLDDRAVYPLYEELQARGLLLLVHAGYDIAYPGNRRAEPEKIRRVRRDFPRLKLVAAHLGGWNLWEEVLQHLAGEDIYLETSMAAGYCRSETLRAILQRHDPGKILFGSDSPWTDQAREIELWRGLGLEEKFLEKLFSGNALNLLRAWAPGERGGRGKQ